MSRADLGFEPGPAGVEGPTAGAFERDDGGGNAGEQGSAVGDEDDHAGGLEFAPGRVDAGASADEWNGAGEEAYRSSLGSNSSCMAVWYKMDATTTAACLRSSRIRCSSVSMFV